MKMMVKERKIFQAIEVNAEIFQAAENALVKSSTCTDIFSS